MLLRTESRLGRSQGLELVPEKYMSGFLSGDGNVLASLGEVTQGIYMQRF